MLQFVTHVRAAPAGERWRGMSPSTAGGNDARSAQRALRILIADDNPDEVLTLTALLRYEGHDVRGVYSGGAAVGEARSFEPDVYILDIGMPGMSGYDLARTLRLRYGGRPVLIAITAWQTVPDQLAAKIAGFDHHFGKPFEPQALLNLLKVIGSSPIQH